MEHSWTMMRLGVLIGFLFLWVCLPVAALECRAQLSDAKPRPSNICDMLSRQSMESLPRTTMAPSSLPCLAQVKEVDLLQPYGPQSLWFSSMHSTSCKRKVSVSLTHGTNFLSITRAKLLLMTRGGASQSPLIFLMMNQAMLVLLPPLLPLPTLYYHPSSIPSFSPPCPRQ